MKDKFITNTGVEIPLDKSGFVFVEENPRFKDSFWTNYTLPISVQYDRDFLSKFGQYSSHTNTGLKRYHEGIHLFEGKIRKGKLEIMEFRNNNLKLQIDSGFENLPNFDKKLSELPLLEQEVTDIYDHANEIITKKYPDTEYNFPRLYTDEYNLDDEAWKYFDSFINNRNNLESTTGEKVFPRNRVENGTDVYNKNIIHPMPYLLYVLQVGFMDAGFRLSGEILEDPYLKQRCIWSGTHYYVDAEQKEHKATIYQEDFYETEMSADYAAENSSAPEQGGKWKKQIRIGAPGRYRLIIDSNLNYNGQKYEGKIKISSSQITDLQNLAEESLRNNNYHIEKIFSVSEAQALKGAEILIECSEYGVPNQEDQNGNSIGIAQIYINPIRQHTDSGVPIIYVFNENKINLKKAVPDMTFGDLVNTIKNLRNYDLEFIGNKAVMNIIKVDKTIPTVPFEEFEVPDPIRTFNDKSFFNLKFPDVEDIQTQNIFIDDQGYHMNYKDVPSDATEININVFCLPMTYFRGVYTAKAYSENALMLVYYDGLKNGDNNASNPEGLMDESLAQNLVGWYKNRLTNFSYKWKFVVPKNKIRKYNIRSEISCYNKKHWIKSWTKKSLSDTLYLVEIETETF